MFNLCENLRFVSKQIDEIYEEKVKKVNEFYCILEELQRLGKITETEKNYEFMKYEANIYSRGCRNFTNDT